jgi:hypothetical protein
MSTARVKTASVVIVLNGGSALFDEVLQGWEHKCKDRGAVCHVRVGEGGEACVT